MTEQRPLPGRGASLWLDTTEQTEFPAMDGDRRVDTAILGGGIAGVTAAVHCKEAGQDVALIEKNRVIEGVTGKTTAKVTSLHALVYHQLLKKHGRRRVEGYADANSAAVEEIADRVEAHDIDCNFGRIPAYTYAADESERSEVESEVSAAKSLGLPATFVADPPFPERTPGAVRFDEQAHFHPREYLLDLVEEIPGEGSHVFENTKATDIEDGSPCRVETTGGTVTADSVLVATHFPIEDPAAYFARQFPKRSYILAVTLASEPPQGLFYRKSDPYFSVRPYPGAEGNLTLVGGQNHKTGQGGSTAERYRTLERQAREHLDVESVEYRWSTQDYNSADRIPYVGQLGPGIENVYAATGFGGWGMTNGTAAGMLLAQFAEGDPDELWAHAFDPERIDPEAGAKEFLKENLDVGKEFTRDWAKAPFRGKEPNVAPGEGEVVRRDGKQLAVARDEDGELHVASAVCTHMDCIVHWNDAEQSWDCPCHGSRFSVDGDVLDGPAVEDLPKRGE
jgi:glycine/D-amino acid oxidase-like deaminating enzyme/nitrite reductase/ring-hydroxylating ferredoxin subunit